MTDEYMSYMLESARRAEVAMFDLRNILRGAGGLSVGCPNKYDEMAIAVDNYRTSVAVLIHKLEREG